MLALRKVLQSVEKGLEMLAQRTNDMQRLLDNLEEALSTEKPKGATRTKAGAARVRPARKATARRKATRTSDTQTVFSLIEKSRKGISTAEIKAKTGFSERKIWDIVSRLKKQGNVKSKRKGLYVKA